MRNKKVIAVLFALLAAILYAINIPFSKMLLEKVPSTLMAGFLYLGAGIGISALFLFNKNKIKKEELLSRADLKYTVGMVILDILAPIFLMYGITKTTSANASLLNNFEIVATAVIALVFFKEAISKSLWAAIFFVTLSSIVLTFEDISSFNFSIGSLFVLLAAICWGIENNCTRNISSKNTYQIVTIKGIGSGVGSIIIALVIGEKVPEIQYILLVILLGFVAYGLSIFLYIKAQSVLGAAKTSAYYAVAPFVGAFLSFIFLNESFTMRYFVALLLMLIGSLIATVDTLINKHKHVHTHVITHNHNGVTHTHEVTHSHEHVHLLDDIKHKHPHKESVSAHR